MNQVDLWVCWKVLLWRRVCFSAIFISVLALRYFFWLLSLDFRHFLFSSAWFYFHLMFNDDRSMSLALLMWMRVRLCAPVCNTLDLKQLKHIPMKSSGIASASFLSFHNGIECALRYHNCVAIDFRTSLIFYSIEKQTILSVMKQNYVFNRIW